MGYTGGTSERPTYESVCRGDGHTEALKIRYDPQKTDYKELLDLFWKQYRGSSGKPQYKSAIWYHNEEQKRAIEDSMAQYAARSGRTPKLDVLPATKWNDAEDYHQKYYSGRPLGKYMPAFAAGTAAVTVAMTAMNELTGNPACHGVGSCAPY